MNLLQLFASLTAATAIGIVAHEAAHHLLGPPSSFSLSRNWPEVKVTEEHRLLGARGALAGPLTNLALGMLGAALTLTGIGMLRQAGFLLGIANLSITVFAAAINLAVDTPNRQSANDLTAASRWLRLPFLLLPALFIGVPLPVLLHLWEGIGFRPLFATAFCLAAFFTGGSLLMGLDRLFKPRFRIIHRGGPFHV